MILAAGLGTRLRPVTDHLAKPAVPFLNVPLLYYSMALLAEGGADQFVVNAHYKPEQIEHLVSCVPGDTKSIAVSHEAGAPLGSGGGVWKARSYLEGGSGNFFLANGDEVILPHEAGILSRLRTEHEKSDALSTILVMRHPLVGTQFGGVWADSEGHVHGFGKDPTAFPGCTGYHYIGLQILSDRVFQYLPEGESNILYDALAKAIAKGEKVRILESTFSWFETGNTKDFVHATGECLHLLVKGAAKGAQTSTTETQFLTEICRRFWPMADSRPSLWMGTGSHCDPGTIEDGAIVLAGNDVRVEQGAHLKGFVVLGDSVHVRSGAVVENSVVIANSTVESTSYLSNTIHLPG